MKLKIKQVGVFAAGILFCLSAMSATLPVPVDPSDPAIRYVGRFTDDYRFGWTGCKIEVDFAGSAIEAELEVVQDAEAGLTIVVDGVPTFLKAVTGQTTYLLAENLEAGVPHRIVIFKRSEGAKGTVRFNGFAVSDDGVLSRPPTPARKMLVIGDSITCGYGNEALTLDEGNTTENENGYMSYASIAGRSLDADVMMFCWSGRGMYRNGPGNSADTIPQMFNQTLPKDRSLDWNHSNVVPDVIVINLGTNDMRNKNRDPIGHDDFVGAYTNFLTRIRGYYPDSTLVLSIGPMQKHPVTEWLPEIASGFPDTSVLVYASFSGPEDKGGHYHPSVLKDRKMAAKLVEKIEQVTDWVRVDGPPLCVE